MENVSCDWLVLLTIMSSRFIHMDEHVTTGNRIPFLFKAE
jgi:hypothetical protein